MKTIGLIGGMSWESTAVYYRVINETVSRTLGGLHSARCILFSVDFDEIEACQANGDWERSAQILADAAAALERAGADFLVICTNTMHKVLPLLQKDIHIPFLHIAEMTALELEARGIRKAGLLGTRYTMEQAFYKSVLEEYGIEVIVPDTRGMETVHTVIYQELCKGIISDRSRARYLEIISGLSAKGAQGVILGCTEIGLLVRQEDTEVPLFDTTEIHARRAALRAIQNG